MKSRADRIEALRVEVARADVALDKADVELDNACAFNADAAELGKACKARNNAHYESGKAQRALADALKEGDA